MSVLNSPAGSEIAEQMETPSQTQLQAQLHTQSHTGGECPIAKMTGDILPSCFLLGIVSGFTAFVAFGQAVLPAMVAAVAGALIGLFFACEKEPAARNAPASGKLPRAGR